MPEVCKALLLPVFIFKAIVPNDTIYLDIQPNLSKNIVERVYKSADYINFKLGYEALNPAKVPSWDNFNHCSHKDKASEFCVQLKQVSFDYYNKIFIKKLKSTTVGFAQVQDGKSFDIILFFEKLIELYHRDSHAADYYMDKLVTHELLHGLGFKHLNYKKNVMEQGITNGNLNIAEEQITAFKCVYYQKTGRSLF